MPYWSVDDIRAQLRSLGAKPKHEQRVLRLWSQALPQTQGRRPLESFMPASVRQALPEIEAQLQAQSHQCGQQAQNPDRNVLQHRHGVPRVHSQPSHCPQTTCPSKRPGSRVNRPVTMQAEMYMLTMMRRCRFTSPSTMARMAPNRPESVSRISR